MSRVNFDAKYDYDFVKNFKILQVVFDKMKVKKHVPVAKLVKAKYQDNLEFFQWMKNFFNNRYGGEEYDAVARRKAAKGGKARRGGSKNLKGPSSKRTGGSRPKADAKRRPSPAPRGPSGGGSASSADVRALEKKNQKLKDQVAEMVPQIELLEKERTFYYSKLRAIEVLLQETESEAGLKDKVLAILYQTDDGFEAPPDEDEGAEPDEA